MGLSSAREMTLKLAEAGVDGIKVTGYNEEELRDILEVAHAHGLLVFGHTRLDPGALRAVQIGLDGIEHVTDVLEDCVEQNPPFPPDFDWSNRTISFVTTTASFIAPSTARNSIRSSS